MENNKKKEYVTLEITDMADTGQGIARKDDVVYFVNCALIGDIVEAKIIKSKKNYRVSEAMKISSPSPFRKAGCTNLSEGVYGLSLKDLTYKKQLEIKEKKVRMELFKSLGYKEKVNELNNFDFKINPIIGLEQETRYRNKGVFPVREQNGKMSIGSFERASHNIIDNLDNISMPESYFTILNIIKSWAEKNSLKAYNEISDKGNLKFITIRSNFEGEHLVILSLRENKLPDVEELVLSLQNEKINVLGVIKSYKPEKSNTPMGGKNYSLFGKDFIYQSIGISKFKISPESFFQVSTEGSEKLYAEILRMIKHLSIDELWDIYCGVGSIGIFLANHLNNEDLGIKGLESVETAVEMAKLNAEINGLKNIEFQLGKAEKLLPGWIKKYNTPDVIIVDPPRKGLDRDALDAVIQANSKHILYVSCNPSTLARDLKIITDNGYKIIELTPVDLFPMTMHVECVVLLSKVQNEMP